MTPPALRCDQAKLPQDVTPLALRCDPDKCCGKIEGFYGSNDESHGSIDEILGVLSIDLILIVLVNLISNNMDLMILMNLMMDLAYL